ncbi:MAG: GumC family protein [Thermoanaerobaculia bacterium]
MSEIEFGAESPSAERPGRQVRLREYWALLLKHRRLVALCLITGVGVAALISLLSPPRYRATAVVAVEKERQNPLESNWSPQVYGGADPEFLPTQMRLIGSREIAERVVQRLNLIENREFNEKRSGLFRSGREDGAAGLSRDALTQAAERIQSGINVAPIRGTSLLEVSFVASSPKLAAEIANAIAEAYVAWNMEAKVRLVAEASDFLTAQTDQLKEEIEEKEQQLLAYGRQKDIISMDPRSNVTLQKLEALNSDYAAAVGDRVAKEARYHELQNARPEVVADVSALQDEQARLEREYAEKLNLYKPEWPAMVQLQERIEKVREQVATTTQERVGRARETARNEYLTAMRREGSLRSVLQTQKSEAMTLNTNAVEYNNLNVEVETKRALLDTLLKRKAEIGMMAQMGGGERASNVRIVDRALPPRGRFRPSYRQNGLFGLFFGSVAGIGLALFLGYLDRSLRTAEQVEQYLGLPALGVIPAVHPPGKERGYAYGLMRRKKTDPADETAIELLPHAHPRTRVAEAYRSFRTALLLSRAGGVKSIVITSAVSQEGKSSTAVNLAVVLGQLGKRVLLVDADLHKPRLHEILRVSNRLGLVSVLAENLQPAQAVMKTEIPGVSVVPSGPASPNPSGLLSSEGMSRFLELARMNFDFTIIDAPPIHPVADALVLGHQIDGVVLCVRGGKTPREEIARVLDILHRSHVRVLGVLINNLEEPASAYGLKASYDYGYYGEDRENEPAGTRAALTS